MDSIDNTLMTACCGIYEWGICVNVLKLPPNVYLMTSSNGNISRFTGPLWGESTGLRWIPLTKANDGELWNFL